MHRDSASVTSSRGLTGKRAHLPEGPTALSRVRAADQVPGTMSGAGGVEGILKEADVILG